LEYSALVRASFWFFESLYKDNDDLYSRELLFFVFFHGLAVFFVGGWRTTQEAIMATREWGNDKRKGLDQMLGVTERVDDDHPELLERQKLTPEEERAYLVQKYWAAPQKETTTIDATLSQQTQQEGVLETNKDSSKS